MKKAVKRKYEEVGLKGEVNEYKVDVVLSTKKGR